MPGVIMENGGHAHTNHERERLSNGVNGGSAQNLQDKGKQRSEREPQQNITPTSPTGPNGLNGAFQGVPGGSGGLEHGRMSQLPEEIQHITEGYVPVSKLLERMVLKTHTKLGEKIQELARMPVPPSVAASSNASHKDGPDDNSGDNIAKKKLLLEFAQSQHTDWVKALVITNWSRRAEDVGKCIDLHVHLMHQYEKYGHHVQNMAELKRSLGPARLPNPDFKTALQVLSTGTVPWMPDIGYVDPPPLTARDLLKSLTNLNTLLSIRLNLQEYDKIPLQFRDYSIKSGRVTFKVAGEFEVDLTIADEDPEKQFWFIDFRFLFKPSLLEISPYHRSQIEHKVNASLSKDGLSGCYRVLHEMVLTHKISELRRQAVHLANGTWIGSLKPELLHRTLSLHYWQDRYHNNTAPKSWVLVGVHSGRRKDGRPDPKATSRLSLRWFQDGKEMQDVVLPFNEVDISTESLLKTVIAEHTRSILTTAYQGLRNLKLFATGELALSLSISSVEPADSELKVQISGNKHVSLSIEAITGRVVLSPASFQLHSEASSFAARDKDPAKEAQGLIELARCSTVEREITTHAISTGWTRVKNPPIADGGLKSLMPKDSLRQAWYQKPGWKRNWFLVASLSMSGEQWMLIELAWANDKYKALSKINMPIKSTTPETSYSFFSTLTIFAAALVSQNANLRELQKRKAHQLLRKPISGSQIKLPHLCVRLSDILRSGNKSSRTGQPWAKDTVQLTFEGLEISSQSQNSPPSLTESVTATAPIDPPQQKPTVPETVVLTQARIVVLNAKALSILKEGVDKDIAFHTISGVFAFRLRSVVGESVIPMLVERIGRVERLVEFVEVLHNYENVLNCESISLGNIMFAYQSASNPANDAMAVDKADTISYRARIDFAVVDKPMTLNLDKGNPHIRISDHLAFVLNRGQGLAGVASLLPITLPLLRAFDSIESAWDTFGERGEPLVMVRTAQMYTLRYSLTLPAPTLTTTVSRKIVFDIKLGHRRGEAWWHVKRDDKRGEEDEFDVALKSIWTSTGDGWQGMRLSAVARPNGIEDLLAKVDEVIRCVEMQTPLQPQQAPPLAQQSKPQQSPPNPPQPVQQQRPQPMAHMTNQQVRQQPTPNHSQSQGHSQGNNSNSQRQRVIVEID